MAANSPLVPSRFRPVGPIRTMLSGLSGRTSLTVYRPYSVVAFNSNLMFRGTPNSCQLLGVGAMVVVGEIRLRGQSLFDRCVIGSHQNPCSVARAPVASSKSLPCPCASSNTFIEIERTAQRDKTSEAQQLATLDL